MSTNFVLLLSLGIPDHNEKVVVMLVPELNEDCLHKIFSYLSVYDLSCVAQGYKHWQSYAESYFFRKYLKLDFSKVFQDGPAMQQTNSILCNFGSLIQSLSVSHWTFGANFNVLLEYAAEFCDNLKELYIVASRNTSMQNTHIFGIVSKCAQLRILEIKFTYSGSDLALFKDILSIVQKRDNGIRLKVKIYGESKVVKRGRRNSSAQSVPRFKKFFFLLNKLDT